MLEVNLLVVELKADTEDGVRPLILPLSDFKEGLAKITAEIQAHLDTERGGPAFRAVMESLAEFPTCPPSLLVSVRGARAVEDSSSVVGAHVGKGIAQFPALLEGSP